MFRNTFQSGFLSILYAVGSKPLLIWEAHVKNGHIKRLTDPDIRSAAIEIMGRNVSTAYITCPADPNKTLGIKLPCLVMNVKNMKKYFTLEVTILDDKGVRRRFRASNFTHTTRVEQFICTMPMSLSAGWNSVAFNFAHFTKRAYMTNYVETLRVQVHANVRIRRIFFCDQLYSDEALPREFRLPGFSQPPTHPPAAVASAEAAAAAAAGAGDYGHDEGEPIDGEERLDVQDGEEGLDHGGEDEGVLQEG